MDSYILLIDGPDCPGLIHKITGTIFYQGLNIISNSEFVGDGHDHFFMRSEFTGVVHEDNLIAGLENALSGDYIIKLEKQRKKRIVILATKEHHCLADILIRNEYNKYNAEVVSVISNYDNLESLVERFNVPFHYVPHKDIERSTHEEEIMKLIDKYNPDYIVLAKYMRILTPDFVETYKNKIINIHHSFLPAFIGADPYEQAFKRGVKIIGATAHFVTENLDEGPIIVQEVLPINHKFTAEDMKQAGQDVESLALAKAMKLVFEDRVFVRNNKTIIFE